jgi:hypothetical protein
MKDNCKNNKEILDELTDYFCAQDPRLIAQALAGCLLDIKRLINYSKIGPDEAECLQMRLKLNMKQLQEFLDGKRYGDFKTKVMNSNDSREKEE